MKKLFPGILALLMAFSCFAGCGDKTPDGSTPDDSTPSATVPGDSTPDDSTPDDSTPAQVHDVDLRDVKNSIISELNGQNALSNKAYPIRNSFAFPNAPTVFYDVAWEAIDESGNPVPGVTIVEGDNNDIVNINVSDDVQYFLKGTITCPEECCTASFTLNARTASAAPVPVAITEAPVEGTAYKLYVYEGSEGKDCFPTGEPKSDKYPYYWLTTSDYAESIDLYVTNVEGGFNLYHVVDGTNVYLNIVKVGNYTNSLYQTLEDNATPSVWTYDADMGTIVVDLDGSTCYLGCDGGYDTIEAQYKTGDGYYVAYLCTMKNKSEIVITDEDKVSTTLDELNLTLKYTLDKSNIILPTNGSKYQEVSVSWSVEADKGATLTQNILDLVIPAEKTTVVLTATVACGDVTETKTFELELGPKTVVTDSTDPASILAAAFNLAPGEALEGKYTLTGEIKTIKTAYDEEHKNITVIITIGDKEMECYRLKGSDTTDASALKVGDTITVEGSIKNHYGTVEFDSGCILLEVVAGGETPDTPDEPVEDPTADTVLTIPEALALGASKDHNTYTAGKYYVIGEIQEVYNTEYGNMKIVDADGNVLTVYGTYSADGETRYDALETKPVAGDTVKVYGIIGQYNGTAQMKNGWIVEHTPAAGGETPDTPDEPEEPAIQTLTIAEAIALGNTYAHNAYTTDKYYVTGKITEVQNTTYGNVIISDGTNSILVYGLYIDVADSDTDTRYDAMETKPLVGDTVKLLSVVGKFNPNPQLKNAFLVELTAATDAEKVALEKDALTLPEVCNGEGNFALIATGANRAEVVISWELTAGSDIASIADGKLSITNPSAETTVTVMATLTCNQAIETRTFNILVKPSTGATWKMVTDASQLIAGAQVVIVAKDANYAISDTQNSNNRGQADISKANGTLTYDETVVEVLTLCAGTTDGTFAFQVEEGGYLYAASSSKNYLKTENTLSANSSWTIAIAADGTATVTAQGSNTRNVMQYNQSSSLFSCYGSASQKAICIYIYA